MKEIKYKGHNDSELTLVSDKCVNSTYKARFFGGQCQCSYGGCKVRVQSDAGQEYILNEKEISELEVVDCSIKILRREGYIKGLNTRLFKNIAGMDVEWTTEDVKNIEAFLNRFESVEEVWEMMMSFACDMAQEHIYEGCKIASISKEQLEKWINLTYEKNS